MNDNFSTMAKIAIDKSFLKEYKKVNLRTVYMNDGDEFQIQLFNPTQGTITARIRINNEWMPHEIIIMPGQRLWIERYTHTPKKFKFITYDVNKSDAVQNAIRYNGDIYIEFRREQKMRHNTYTLSLDYPYSNIHDWNNTIPNTITTTTGDINGYTSNITDTWVTSTLLAQSSCDTTNIANFSCKTRGVEPNKCETGRISQGSYSDQGVTYSHCDTEYTPFSVAHFKILPMSQKPVTASDMKKIYCTNCGRRLNTKYRYCPYCGHKA